MKTFFRTSLLIIFLLAVFYQCENSHHKVIRKIKIQESALNQYNIVYENLAFKLYFNKSKFRIYVNKSIYREDNEVKDLVSMMDTISNTINFSDPYWEMHKNPRKYGVVPETYTGFDNTNSPGSIIDNSKYLKESKTFENVMRSYLIEGEVRIFDKTSKKFLDIESLDLIEWAVRSKDGNSSSGDYYALPNGKKIIDRNLRSTV